LLAIECCASGTVHAIYARLSYPTPLPPSAHTLSPSAVCLFGSMIGHPRHQPHHSLRTASDRVACSATAALASYATVAAVAASSDPSATGRTPNSWPAANASSVCCAGDTGLSSGALAASSCDDGGTAYTAGDGRWSESRARHSSSAHDASRAVACEEAKDGVDKAHLIQRVAWSAQPPTTPCTRFHPLPLPLPRWRCHAADYHKHDPFRRNRVHVGVCPSCRS